MTLKNYVHFHELVHTFDYFAHQQIIFLKEFFRKNFKPF
jgi:hypothetical protein